MYLGIYFTSVGYFRLALYELFLILHILLQATALVMLFFHHHDARPYVLAAAGIWILDRGIVRIAHKKRTFIATLDLAVDNETILLYVDVPVNADGCFGLTRGWSAGQHVFLTIPSMGMKYKFQAHPFTIASPSPRRQSCNGAWPLQLTIRAQDGFSRQLLKYAKLHQHARVYLDGPYGSNKILEAVQGCDRLCLVAGGSGIAVTYPLAWVREIGPRQSANIIHDRTIYRDGVRISPNLKKSMLLIDQPRFAHFWVRQDARHESWVTMLPGAGAPTHPDCSPAAPLTTASRARDLVTHRFVTRSSTGEHQRPDIRAELIAWVTGDLKQKVNMRHDICVVVSGPDGLVRDVQNTVASLIEEGWSIGIHVEKFGW